MQSDAALCIAICAACKRTKDSWTRVELRSWKWTVGEVGGDCGEVCTYIHALAWLPARAGAPRARGHILEVGPCATWRPLRQKRSERSRSSRLLLA